MMRQKYFRAIFDGENLELLDQIEEELAALARDGDIDALLEWRAMQVHVDYEELGWGG